MTVIAYISVVSSLVGGGLYALRAGRCGCDSLSLAGSRQRVKSLRSSVRLRLGHILLARSSSELTPASPPSNLPRARRTARLRLTLLCSFLTSSLQSQTRPEEVVSVRTRYPGLRSCIRVPSSWFPRSRRSLKSPSSEPLQPLRLHTPHKLVRAAGLSRSNLGDIVPLFDCLCVLPEYRLTSLQRPTAGRLPRPTALPPMSFEPVCRLGCRRSDIQSQTT